jgi:transcriptional regulator with XRE-family HTH domain
MKLCDAITKRVWEVCDEKKISIYEISQRAACSPSAVYDIAHNRIKSSRVSTIVKFCDGAGISVAEFFSAPYFSEIDAIGNQPKRSGPRKYVPHNPEK